MQSNAKMEFLRKRVRQQRYPNPVNIDLPLYIMYTLKYRDSLITDRDKHALRPCLFTDLTSLISVLYCECLI